MSAKYVDPMIANSIDGTFAVAEYAPFNVYAGRNTSIYAIDNFSPSLTKQEFADEADINVIMARYEATGTVPVNPNKQPFYVDNVDMPDFMEAQNILLQAESAFMSLPAKVRREFDNDPAEFVRFANDEKNADRLAEWGMLSPEAVELRDARRREELDAAAQAAATPPAPAVKPAGV